MAYTIKPRGDVYCLKLNLIYIERGILRKADID